jgi:hypothetical protein
MFPLALTLSVGLAGSLFAFSEKTGWLPPFDSLLRAFATFLCLRMSSTAVKFAWDAFFCLSLVLIALSVPAISLLLLKPLQVYFTLLVVVCHRLSSESLNAATI